MSLHRKLLVGGSVFAVLISVTAHNANAFDKGTLCPEALSMSVACNDFLANPGEEHVYFQAAIKPSFIFDNEMDSNFIKVRGGDNSGGDGGGDGGSTPTPPPPVVTTTSCQGVKNRTLTCRDYKNNPVAEAYCDQVGVKPSITTDCDATCTSVNGTLVTELVTEGSDPLVFDLDGNGVSLTSCSEGVMFDIDNDGVADQTGWTDGVDGLLAIDDNNDGQINNQSELFGNNANLAFQNLAEYDSNEDGVITADDLIWDDLIMWVDSDRDGVSSADEMKTLNDIGIDSIDLGYTTVDEVRAGNTVTKTGTFSRVLEDGVRVVREVIETLFNFFTGAS